MCPLAKRLPALGLCLMTFPLRRFAEAFLVTLPTLQWAALIRVLALASVLPTTLGTLQGAFTGGGGGGGGGGEAAEAVAAEAVEAEAVAAEAAAEAVAAAARR